MSRRTTLFVAGIGSRSRARDLAREFERYGRLVRCDIPAPRNFNARPYAFVEFEDPRDAEDAFEGMQSRRFEGYSLNIQWAKNAPSRTWRYEGRSRSRSRSPRRRRSSRSRSRSPPRGERRRPSRSHSPRGDRSPDRSRLDDDKPMPPREEIDSDVKGLRNGNGDDGPHHDRDDLPPSNHIDRSPTPRRDDDDDRRRDNDDDRDHRRASPARSD